MEIKIKLTKTGKPYKSSLEKAKREIKANFSEVKKESLPKALQGYYNQVASGKRRGEANKQRLRNESGKFYTSAESNAIKKTIKTTAIETGISEEELIKNKSLFKTIVQKTLEDSISITKDTDLLVDFIKRQKFEKITLIDQNGNKKVVNLANAIFILKQSNKKILEKTQEELFQFFNKITFNPAGKFAEINYIDPKGLSAEEILDEINSEMESGNFGAASSPKKTKQPKEDKKDPEPLTPANDPEPPKTTGNGKSKKGKADKKGKDKKSNK